MALPAWSGWWWSNEDSGRQIDDTPAGGCLGVGVRALVLAFRHLLSSDGSGDADGALLHVEVTTTQAADLPGPETTQHGHSQRWSVVLLNRVEVWPHLVRTQGLSSSLGPGLPAPTIRQGLVAIGSSLMARS